MLRFASILLVLGSVALASAQSLRFAPPEPSPTDRYERVLSRYAQANGFDYAGLSRDAEARADLDAFLRFVAELPEDAELADWLNAYNALVIASVTARHPIHSVMDVPGFFSTQKHRIARRERTLDELENDIIRGRFHDPRVHFALNCAARSCPLLRRLAFRPASLRPVLDELTRAALASPAHARWTEAGLELSALFFWFQADFVRSSGSVQAFVKRYAPAAWAGRVGPDTKLSELPYDWSLSSAP